MVRSLVLAVVLGVCGCAGGEPLPLPPRAPDALTGSQFLPPVKNLARDDRERAVWEEITAGNVPDFLRRFVPITVETTIGGRVRTVIFEVAPDYLGVGSDEDWFRMPMSPILGQQVCDLVSCTLPTRRMVDAIWAQAPVRLEPFPFSPTTYDILSCSLFYEHHLQIESQRAGPPDGLLVAGIKKDVVISALIKSWPARVVIYGWHRPNGVAIQPRTKVHEITYADYSHGIRLVRNAVLLDGRPSTVAAILADPTLHPLLSDEGPFTSSHYPTEQ